MTAHSAYLLTALILVSAIILSEFLFGWVLIREDQVGHVVKKLSTTQLPQGRIVALNGEAGYQARTLPPGLHFWLWPWMCRIDKRSVVAKDGNALPSHRILAPLPAKKKLMKC